MLSLTCIVAVQLGLTEVRAQSLDDELVRLLDNNCIVLGGGQVPSDRSEFGDNIIAICEIPQTSNGASSGGGAAAVQASALSIQNSATQQRLERAKREARGENAQDVSWLLRGRDARVLASEDQQGAAGLGGSRFDLFASANYESLDRGVTEFEDGYDSSVTFLSVGADYRFRSNLVGGVVATYRKQDGDFDGQGDFEMESFEPALYLSMLPSQRTFVQVVAGYGDQQFDTRRDVSFTIDRQGGGGTTQLSGIATSGTNATVWSAGAQAGYDWSTRNYTYGPRLGINYSDTDVDAYTEDGDTGLEMRVADRSVESLQGVVGFFGSAAYSKKSGVFLPQASLEYVQEFEDSASILSAQLVEDLRGPGATTFQYQTNVPDSSFFNLNLGLAVGLANGIWPYANVRVMFGNEHFDSVGATIGARFEL